MSKRGLPESMAMRHDEHYVEALVGVGRRPDRPADRDRADRSQSEPAAPGDGRPVGADGVDCREGHPGAAGCPPARRSLPDHRRRAALSGGGAGGPSGSAGRRARRRRCRDAGDRADREPPAQGSHAVRRSRSAAGPGRELRLYARGPRQAAGQVPDVGHRVAGAHCDAGRDPKSLSAGRHFL